jgi:hypothetical protein
MNFKIWLENFEWDFSHEESFGGTVQQKNIGGVRIVFQMQSNGNVGLSSIRVPIKERRKGKARLALSVFLKETDKAGKPVELIASPLDKKTDIRELIAFYQSEGFEIVGRGNAFGEPKMVRQPPIIFSKISQPPLQNQSTQDTRQL